MSLTKAVEIVRAVDILSNDLRGRINISYTLLKTKLNTANHKHICAAKITHFLILTQQGCKRAGEEITLELAECNRCDIRTFCSGINDRKTRIGKFSSDCGNSLRIFRT